MTRPGAPKECPTHRGQPADNCGRCEALIAAREDALDPTVDHDPGGRMADREADRYERWIESSWP